RPFYGEGVGGLILWPGVETAEVEAMIDAVLQVTGPQPGDDDLVTLLWQAQLHHVQVDYVPAESDLGSAETGDSSEVAMWPTAEMVEEDNAITPEGSVQSTTIEESAEPAGRSDDWTMGEHTIEIEATFDELETLADGLVRRFREDFERERNTSLSSLALGLARVYVQAGSNPDDRLELGRFLPRVLRLAASLGNWREARESMLLLRACEGTRAA